MQSTYQMNKPYAQMMTKVTIGFELSATTSCIEVNSKRLPCTACLAHALISCWAWLMRTNHSNVKAFDKLVNAKLDLFIHIHSRHFMSR
jgi:hypothetical protein